MRRGAPSAILPLVSVLSGFAPLSRRGLLKGGLALGGAVLVAEVGLLGVRGHAPSARGLRCLGDQAYRTLSRLAEALFPAGGAFAAGAADVDLARAFDAFLADEPEDERRDLGRALVWLEWGPVLYDRRGRTFSRLGEAERLEHFERWGVSDDLLRRQVAVAFRRFLSIVFYDRPEVWPHLGYDGPLFRPVAP